MKNWIKKRFKIWWVKRKLFNLEELRLVYGVYTLEEYTELKTKLEKELEDLKDKKKPLGV